MDTIQDEVAPQVNGEKVEKESPDANDISAVEEKAAEEKTDDASEVGFKKIFRFVGFKFTLKKDKSEEKDPVKLLTVKDKEEEEVSGTDEPTKEEEAATAEEKSTAEETEANTEVSTVEAEVSKDGDKAETPEEAAEGPATEAADEVVTDEGAEKEAEGTAPSQETTLSPLKKLFNGVLFSNLRKKASIKKTKEEEGKEGEGDAAKAEEGEEKDEKEEVEGETKEMTPEGEQTELKEEAAATSEEAKPESPQPEVTDESSAAAVAPSEETKQEVKLESSSEEEKVPAEVTSEAELLSSQEKAKPQGSPLKKLFTGAGLKKLSTKKQKAKKDAETKLTESGEQAAEQLQSSTESTEAPKADSGPSSPEESGEHVIAVEVTQIESSQETDGEVTSDGEKKKEGIIAWSSFKKLVTPKKRVKRPSESEDEATGEKQAKSATLSSSESAPLADKSGDEEAKEEKPADEESKTDNAEKLVSSTEEPKKKMDTSVSWEALMCMGGPKKRTRKTSDSEDEETKIEEELPAAAATTAADGEKEEKTEATEEPQTTETEPEVVASPEPVSTPPERESAWDTLKRIVMPKKSPKAEEKTEEPAEQVQSDSEAPKEESTFSLKKFLPGRKKKKVEKQPSNEPASAEEDSDTPAVVPLSEYDKSAEVEPEAPVEPAVVQIKVSAEDRSPSWIPAIVEDDKQDELSDIPEEAENTATPKSIDTEATEDETEDAGEAIFPLKVPGRAGRRLSTAEVKPVAPAPSAETTPVPQGPQPDTAQEVREGIEAQVGEIPEATSVAVEDAPIEVASEETEYEPPTEMAESKTNTLLEPHARSEAMAICTGLGTKEIAKVAMEKPVTPVIETMTVIRDALGSEVTVEEKAIPAVEAELTEDEVLTAQIHQVETTKLECAVEDPKSEVVDIQAASEHVEPEIEKAGIVCTALEQTEVLQPAAMSENSPKVVMVNPIMPTVETAVCTLSTEVNEPTIETKEVEIGTEQLAATEENTPVKEVIQAICETLKTTVTKEPETAIPVVVPSEEVPVITKTLVLMAPLSDSDQVAPSDVLAEPVGEQEVQVQEATEQGSVLESVEATTTQIVSSEVTAVVDQASEKIEETTEDVQQESEIEAQSMVITQAVIKDAVDKVSEDKPEPPKPTKPTTPTAHIPTPVQAVATTEKEIEITSETPVVTETPTPIVCKKPAPKTLCVAMEVIDAIPVEVIESLDASEEEDKKAEENLKKAVEVKVSEDVVEMEEVVEIKDEAGEEEEEQSQDTKESGDEVKPQSEAEAPSEENKGKALEIHMPVQVVLQTATVMEDPSVEEEAIVDLDSSEPVAEDTSAQAEKTKLSTLAEEPQATPSAEVSTSSQADTEKKSSVKCAEVMAQVIEVIEEAVKEIEPASTEITAAS